jgi:uncharacterized protein YggE
MEYQTEISVDGKATVAATPDTISLIIRAVANAPEYDDKMQKLNAGAREIAHVLAECGITNAPQTREYSVDEDWVNKYDETKRKLVGYEGVQQVVVDFPIDMARLGRVLQGLGAIDLHPSVTTNFEVKDQSGMLQQARKNALNAATVTAHDMAAQMGLKIVGVKSVNHSMSKEAEPHSLHVDYDGQMLAKMSYSLPEVLPEEVANTANVSVTWLAKA